MTFHATSPDVNVRLRPVDDDFYPLLLQWWNEPQLQSQRGMPGYSFTDGDVRAHYDRAPDLIQAWLLEIPGPEWIGLVEIVKIRSTDHLGSIEIYIGDPGLRGKGHGESAVRQACYFGFSKMKLGILQALAPAHNPRALRCFQKAGFKRVETVPGFFDMGGQVADGVRFQLTRQDYLHRLQFPGDAS